MKKTKLTTALIKKIIKNEGSLSKEKIYDVVFNDDNNSNNKGASWTLEEALYYISNNNGTDWSYFEDYKHGTVSVVNNRSGEDIYQEEVF